MIKRLREMGRDDVRAITVDSDGQWEIREEDVEGGTGDGSGKWLRDSPSNDNQDGQTAARKDSIVIELD